LKYIWTKGFSNPVISPLEEWHKKGVRSLPASSNPLIFLGAGFGFEPRAFGL